MFSILELWWVSKIKVWKFEKKLFLIFSLNHIFTEIQLESIPDQRSISAEVVQVLIHGHSLYDEAAFYELYMTGAIDSRKSLDNFIGTRIPGFKGVTEKEFDAIMSKWLNHLLSRFWILPLVVKSKRAKLKKIFLWTLYLWTFQCHSDGRVWLWSHYFTFY